MPRLILRIGGAEQASERQALWFWCVQIVWFRHRMRIALWRSAVAAAITLLIGAGINLGVGHALPHVQSWKAASVAEPNTKARSSE